MKNFIAPLLSKVGKEGGRQKVELYQIKISIILQSLLEQYSDETILRAVEGTGYARATVDDVLFQLRQLNEQQP